MKFSDIIDQGIVKFLVVLYCSCSCSESVTIERYYFLQNLPWARYALTVSRITQNVHFK